MNDDFLTLSGRLWFPLTQLLHAPAFPADRIDDERMAAEVLTAYAYCYDSGDVDGVVSLFTEDALLINPRGTFEGSNAIRTNFAWLVANRVSAQHLLGNVVARPGQNDDTAWIAAYYHATATNVDGSVRMSVGTYFHRLRRSDGSWQIQQGRITDLGAIGASPIAHEPPQPTYPRNSRELPP